MPPHGGHSHAMITLIAAITGTAAVGVWLRWAVAPVRIAYTAGRQAERVCARLRAGAAGHSPHRPRAAAEWRDEHDL
jgi:hypothetical protein